MGLAATTRGSVWIRLPGPIGALILAAGFLACLAGAIGAEVNSNWMYCGQGSLFQTAPCRCPEGERATTWPDGSTVCFTSAPGSAQAVANLGSATLMIGSILLLGSVLLRLRRPGRTWLLIRSALTGWASLSLAGLAALLVSGPPCTDCPSSPGDPAFTGAAIVTGTAAALALVAAAVPLGFRIASRSVA